MSMHPVQSGARAGRGEESEALAARVEARIEGVVHSRVYGLHVVYSEGALILQGQARTYHAKQLAHEAALDMTGGAISLINRIGVR